MNQDKIGKFISDLRKEKKLTQMELANRVGVSNKAVSKWETGKSIPDFGVFENLCKEFDISVNELLNGERNKKGNDGIKEYLVYKEKQNKNWNYTLLLISFLIIVIIFFSFYFINSYKKYNVYKLQGENVNFKYDGGLLYLSNVDTIFQKGNVEILSNEIKDVYEMIFAIKKDDKYYRVTNLQDAGEISAQGYGYDDEISSASLKYLPSDLYLLVYYSEGGDVVVDEIKIVSQNISTNNKLFSFFKKSIGKEENDLFEINMDKFGDLNKHKEDLLNKGFIISDECTFGDFCLLKLMDNNSYMMVDYKDKYLFYNLNIDNISAMVYEYNYGEQMPSVMIHIDDEKKNTSCRIEYEFSNGKLYDKGGCSKYFEYATTIGNEISKEFNIKKVE